MEYSTPDGKGGPHVFVEDLENPLLDDADRHHLQRVLRLRAGDPLTVSDGHGRWVEARFGTALETTSEIHVSERLLPLAAVGFTPVKGDRPEWTVQKLTEIGVDRIIVLRSDRSVVRWEGERAEKALSRLRLVAREAAMQSRRCWLPTLEGICPALEVMAQPSVARAERGGGRPTVLPETIVVGPEGGWSEREVEALSVTVGLGDYVLRAETAALVAAVYLVGQR
ncbi:MAG: RsmE family RNA methyltransferase [Acidimicrobiia bacterium]